MTLGPLMVGLAGTELSRDERELLLHPQIGGVILFEENCGTHERAAENIRLVKSCLRDNPPLIAIDQEGGPVNRLLLEEAPAAKQRGEPDSEVEQDAQGSLCGLTVRVQLDGLPGRF